MTMFSVLSNADPAIQVHASAAILTVLLTPYQFLTRKPGDRVHKTLGYAWFLAMFTTAMSSFWITGIQLIGPFSPIHLLSLYVLFGLVHALWAVRRGDISLHRSILRSMSLWGLGVAGLFTFLPGRMMSVAVFGPWQSEGFVTLLVLGLFFAFWQTNRAPIRGG